MPSASSSTAPENPLAIGGVFVLRGETYLVDGYLDLTHLIARRESDGQKVRLIIADILDAIATPQSTSTPDEETASSSGTETLSKEDWDIAVARSEKLKTLVEAKRPSKKLAAEVATFFGVHVSTIYRWLKREQQKGIAALAPLHPSGGRGRSRLNDILDDVIWAAIEEHYLTDKKMRISKVMTILGPKCRRANLKVPHANTVRLRVSWLSDKTKDEARDGERGRKRHRPVPGSYKEATHPNSVWQIDHTPLDLCIVDDVYRRNIGRAWLTLVIDVYSRCVVGFYLSLDKPNATSVGMALVHAILPKEGWLAAHGIDVKWPNWGKPIKVHADNDKTFRCDMVTRAAMAQKFDLEWRPVKTPHWGGHIERLLGTLNQEIHTINGTTFSNPTQRGDYKSHEEAEFTFSDSETYVTKYLCGVYHQSKHDGIGRPPIRMYESGILGDAHTLGTGLQAPIKDPMRLRLDFLPFKEVTVQAYGVTWDTITYYDPSIDHWIHARDPETGRKRRFTVRRDPRDLSSIWFLDPDRDVYLKIPYRRMEHPSLNLWELREVRAHLRAQGKEEVDEDLVFDTYEELQRIKNNASDETKEARKRDQKKRTYEKKKAAEAAQVGAATPASQQAPPSRPANTNGLLEDDEEISSFEVVRGG